MSDFVIENGVLTEYNGPGGNVVIPDGVTEIRGGLFCKSKTLTCVTFPESIRIIGAEAFASCNGLTSVTIPPSVTEIRFGAFDWCKNLKDVYIRDLEAWCKIEFGGVFANCGNPLSAGARLHVNGEVLTDLLIPEGIKTVNDYSFCHCVGLRSVVVPAGITTIGSYAFFKCSNLKSVSLSEGIVSIENGAFCKCKKIAEINFPKTVKTIGEVAFTNCCKLTDVILPEGVEMLGDRAFENCGDLKVYLPGSLKRPKADIFGRLWNNAPFSGSTCSIQIEKWSALLTKMVEGCEIEEIITANYAPIPGEILLPVAVKMTEKKGWDSASETGKALFAALSKNAGKLCGVAVTNPAWLRLLCDNKLIKAKDLDAYLGEAEKQENAEIKAMLLNYQNELGGKEVEKARKKKEKEIEAYTEALVERTVARDPARGIEGMTFVITGKLNVWPKVWSSRKEVEEYLARYGAKLGASLTKETDYLVTNDAESGSAKNEKAKKLGVEVISEDTFNQMIGRRFMDAETICVPAWVKTIESAAFSGCESLTSVTIPEGVTSIGNFAFGGCSCLTSVTIPEGVTGIGDRAFYLCKSLTSVTIPDSVTSIGEWAFHDCSSLTSVTIPEGVTSIGERTFAGCNILTEIKLPEKLQIINSHAFEDCEALTLLSVPDGTISIGFCAFRRCKNLEKIYIPESAIDIDILAFENCPKLTIHAPAGSYAEKFAKKNGIPFVAE